MKQVKASGQAAHPALAAGVPEPRVERRKPILLAQASDGHNRPLEVREAPVGKAAPSHRYMTRLNEGRGLLRDVYGKPNGAAEVRGSQERTVAERSAAGEPSPDAASAPSAPTDASGGADADLPAELQALMGDKGSKPPQAEAAPKVYAHSTPKPKAEVAATAVAPKPQALRAKPEPVVPSPAPARPIWKPDEPVRPSPGSPASRYDWSNHGGG